MTPADNIQHGMAVLRQAARTALPTYVETHSFARQAVAQALAVSILTARQIMRDATFDDVQADREVRDLISQILKAEPPVSE